MIVLFFFITESAKLLTFSKGFSYDYKVKRVEKEGDSGFSILEIPETCVWICISIKNLNQPAT